MAYKSKEDQRIYHRQWRKDNPKACREHDFKHKYNLSYEDWVRMWTGQNGECTICGEPFANQSDAFVDRNHKTGKVRGLLCRTCNLGIGYFKDNPKLTTKATEYLKIFAIEKKNIPG